MPAPVNIFVINLPYDTARWEFMEKQLTGLQLPFSTIKATIGKNLTDIELSQLYSKELSLSENGYTLSNTQVACADSHRRIYRTIVEQDIPWALVLEDDVKLHPNITKILNADFVNSSHAEWIKIDYVPANATYLKNWLKQAWKQKVTLSTKLKRLLLRFPLVLTWAIFESTRNYFAKASYPYTTWFGRPLYLASAYIITNKGARKLLPLTEPIRFAADSIQNIAPTKVGLKVVGVVPLLTNQLREQFSSNLTYDN